MKRRSQRVLSLATGISTLAGVVALAVAHTAPVQAAGPNYAFPQHQTYKVGVMPSASQATRDAAVEKQYDSWKATYLVHGCASNEYYVSTKGDSDATNNGPVSEGQGYGMNIVPLMAGYDANAQTEFNGLWQLVKDHEDQYGLMQWQLDGKTCKYYSSGTPDGATDGDLDIGYGLILADKQWGGYSSDAMTWLNNFWNHDVAPDGHLKCEDDGPNTDTRPSDHMIDHLRAFAAYDTSHDWAKVISRTEAVDSSLVANYSPNDGLLSDFVVGADGSSPQPAPANYQEDQPDNIVGYNSIRVPWHMGTDALLNGSSVASFELSEAQKWSACAKQVSGDNPLNVYPHLNLNCTGYSTSDEAEEAGDAIGPSAMASGDQAWTDSIWNYLQTNPYGDGYYGETIKTLVMIVMAGDYWSPASASPPPPTNDFSISASPASGSVSQGSSATVSVGTAVTSGSAESVSLSASGLPSGATASFSPVSVTSGASSTLTIATSSSTPAGTYSVTVTGTASSGSHTATYSLTVTGSGGGSCTAAQLLLNPGFESGAVDWTQTSTLGFTPITQATSAEPAHSGSWIADFNGNGTKDTDTIAQTVTLPAACTTATLTYWLHIDTTENTTTAKPDTFVAQILNSSGTVLATVGSFSNLNAASGYAEQTVNLSSYAGQTITLKYTGTETDTNGGTTNSVIDDTAINVSGSTPPPTNNFSVADSPTSGSVTAGSSVTDSISTAVVSGTAESVALTASGLPSGATASFSPASVTAGGGSTLTIATTSATAAGTYAVTITGTAPSATHTAAFSLTVSAPAGSCANPAQLLLNPGFESGAVDWTQTSTLGFTPITKATSAEPAHSGSWIADFNGNGTKDTDTAAQTVTIPSGCKATLTYWLHIDTTENTTTAKPDTFVAQILNSSGTVLATVGSFSNLNAASGYAQQTVDLSSFAGQTITLKFTGTETDTNGGTTNSVIDDTALTTS